MNPTVYHTLLDRIPRAFRDAASAMWAALVDGIDGDYMGQWFGTPEMQRALEDWHAALAHARAWSALQAAKTLHRQTTVKQYAGDRIPLTVAHFFSLPFDKAIQAFYERNADIFIEPPDLWELYWERGASLAEASAAEMRAIILRDLGDALQAGEPMREWKARMVREQGGLDSYYETVYRTNVAQAYSDGQRVQAEAYPDVIGFRRLTTRDKTTRPNHRAAHGLIWGKDDPRADYLAAPWGLPSSTAAARISL